MTDSIDARQLWGTNHYQRVFILSTLLGEINLDRREDSSKELQPHRMTLNQSQFNNIVDFIIGIFQILNKILIELRQIGIRIGLNTGCQDPYGLDCDSGNLINIASGKEASPRPEMSF